MGVKSRLKKLEKEVGRLDGRLKDLSRSKQAKPARSASKKRKASSAKPKGKAASSARARRKQSASSSNR